MQLGSNSCIQLLNSTADLDPNCVSKSNSPTESTSKYVVLKWKDLPLSLQKVLPDNSEYSYVIETYSELNGDNNFRVTFRINITKENQAKKWLEQMFQSSKCTYRVTRTYKVGQKRVLYKVDMHCQHQQKTLSKRQKGLKAACKRKPNPLMHQLRDKKTKCSSKFTLKIVEPTKKEQYCKQNHIFLSHKTLVQLAFTHNHPIESAHVLSFRPISSETKSKYYKLFQSGHSAASARHYYETMLMDIHDEAGLQEVLSDRAINPLLQDVSRMYDKWRITEYGTKHNGKDLADSLTEEIKMYNQANANSGGKAYVQVYDVGSDEETESDSDFIKPPKTKQKKLVKKRHSQPLIITACTPLMARVHENIQQSGEMIFCDSTSCLEKYNCSLFIISTSSSAGGLPLGVTITSDEKQLTIKAAFQQLLQVVPKASFYGNKDGPRLIMTDDSGTEREALSEVWPKAKLLLCTFHFLQRRWTWLFDSKNKIKHEDRAKLIGKVKEMVYSKTEKELAEIYSRFSEDNTVPQNFKNHMADLWHKRQEWAICYRNSIPTRGNNTNNIAEAGIRIIKDLIFGRIKAYNLVQMFQFVTDALENYMKRKLLNIAHNRFDYYISRKFKGLLAEMVDKSSISIVSAEKKIYHVKSTRDSTIKYIIDMEIGTCSCEKGKNGSPCSHQAAIVYHCHTQSLNFIPTIHPAQRQEIAYLAMGESVRKDPEFYCSLHETREITSNTTKTIKDSGGDFTGSCWDIIRAGALDDTEKGVEINNEEKKADLVRKIDNIAATLKQKLNTDFNDPQLIPGIEKFVGRFQKLSSLQSNAHLASALHSFGSESRRATTLTTGNRRWGKRIGVQATASGRRKYGSKGKGPVQAGRPRMRSYVPITNQKNQRYILPIRRKNQVEKKRPHSLSLNIIANKQNAGKW